MDFLTFNVFITKYVLIFFYYLFSIGFPIGFLLFKGKILKSFPKIARYLKEKTNLKFWLIILVLFLFGELFFRMFFEMLIGYFDMHDYLYTIAKGLEKS